MSTGSRRGVLNVTQSRKHRIRCHIQAIREGPEIPHCPRL